MYTESTFYVLGAVAMEITGLSNVDSVFQELIARPLEMEGCSFSVWSLQKTDPGGGLICSAEEYGKFMRAVFGQTLVSKKLHEEAERFQTELASNMPQWFPLAGEGTFHYALGSWRDAKIDGVLMHSMGAEGFYPYIWRKGRESHWGVFATQGMGVGIAVASIVITMRFRLRVKPWRTFRIHLSVMLRP
jgi:CubicO group peptidase (beta-lactamase class C family)